MATWYRPNSTAGKITSPYGPRGPIAGAPNASTYHLGVDLRAGTYGVSPAIYAASAGTVRRIYKTPLNAWVLEINHGAGIWTRYAHMQRNGILVSVGDGVRGGQHVANASNSGAPTIHLHFEVLVNGKQVDPVPFLKARGVDLTVTTAGNPGGGTGGGNIPDPGGNLPDPIQPKGFLDMLSDEEQRLLYERTMSIYAILIEGSNLEGTKYSGLVQIAAATLNGQAKVPEKVWQFPVHRDGKPVMAIQELANTGTIVREIDTKVK